MKQIKLNSNLKLAICLSFLFLSCDPLKSSRNSLGNDPNNIEPTTYPEIDLTYNGTYENHTLDFYVKGDMIRLNLRRPTSWRQHGTNALISDNETYGFANNFTYLWYHMDNLPEDEAEPGIMDIEILDSSFVTIDGYDGAWLYSSFSYQYWYLQAEQFLLPVGNYLLILQFTGQTEKYSEILSIRDSILNSISVYTLYPHDTINYSNSVSIKDSISIPIEYENNLGEVFTVEYSHNDSPYITYSSDTLEFIAPDTATVITTTIRYTNRKNETSNYIVRTDVYRDAPTFTLEGNTNLFLTDSIHLQFKVNDIFGDVLSVEWDLDNTGTFVPKTFADTFFYPPVVLDTIFTVTGRATDDDGNITYASIGYSFTPALQENVKTSVNSIKPYGDGRYLIWGAIHQQSTPGYIAVVDEYGRESSFYRLPNYGINAFVLNPDSSFTFVGLVSINQSDEFSADSQYDRTSRLVTMDANYNVLWKQPLPYQAYFLRQLSSGDYLIPSCVNPSEDHLFKLERWSMDGSLVWSIELDTLYGITYFVGLENDLTLMVGYTLEPNRHRSDPKLFIISPDGNILARRTITLGNMLWTDIQSYNKEFYIFSIWNGSRKNSEILVLNAELNTINIIQGPDMDFDTFCRLKVTDNGIYLSGSLFRAYTLLHLDFSGNTTIIFQGQNSLQPLDLLVKDDNGVILAGDFHGYERDYDGFFINLDASGNILTP